jgi:hypothetical protein
MNGLHDAQKQQKNTKSGKRTNPCREEYSGVKNLLPFLLQERLALAAGHYFQ